MAEGKPITDTPPHIERLYHEMLMRKSPTDRMRMAFGMSAFIKRVVLASIGDRDDWREQLFLRYYKDDFTPAQREKILAHLRRHRSPAPRATGPSGENAATV